MLISMNQPPKKFQHPSQKDTEAISTEKEYLWRIALVADVNSGIYSWEGSHWRYSPTMRGTFEWMIFLFLFGGGICWFPQKYAPSSNFHTSDLKFALVFRVVGGA